MGLRGALVARPRPLRAHIAQGRPGELAAAPCLAASPLPCSHAVPCYHASPCYCPLTCYCPLPGAGRVLRAAPPHPDARPAQEELRAADPRYQALRRRQLGALDRRRTARAGGLRARLLHCRDGAARQRKARRPKLKFYRLKKDKFYRFFRTTYLQVFRPGRCAPPPTCGGGPQTAPISLSALPPAPPRR